MSIQQEMNNLFVEWDRTSKQYKNELVSAAAAEADHKRERAKFIVSARSENPKLSAAQAETMAEADDDISELYLERLGSAALAEATKHRLFMLRAKSDALRSEKVDEREAARLYADHPGSA